MRKMTEQIVAKSKKGAKNLTKPASVFYITATFFHKTSEAIYHNMKNAKMKLFSL